MDGMRIMSFAKKWGKLKQKEFTSFRFPRKDRDWQVGEVVQVFYKSHSPARVKLGIATIAKSELRKIATAHGEYRPTETEAQADGFDNLFQMNAYFRETYGSRIFEEPINKLTLEWVNPIPKE